jgi:hypothetical protein
MNKTRGPEDTRRHRVKRGMGKKDRMRDIAIKDRRWHPVYKITCR